MTHLYIICGLPFAGKTSLAKTLAQRFGFLRIDLDQINSVFGVGLHGNAISSEEWDRTYAESYRQLGEALAADRSVLYDATNFTKGQRDYLRFIANTHYVSSLIIYVALSESEARQRWLQNRITHERYDIRDEDFEYVVTHFEPPQQDEQVIRYHPSQPLAEWIQQNFSHDEHKTRLLHDEM